MAAAVWTVEEGTWVVAEVAPSSGDCASGVWARAAAAPGQPVPSSAAPPDLAARALAAFRRLPAWAQIQTDFRASVEGATGRWDEAASWSRQEVRVWQSPSAAGERWVSVYARYEDDGWACDGFGAGFWALYALEGGATLRLLTSSTDAGSFFPEAAMMTPGAAPTFFGTEPPFQRVVRSRDATGYPITRQLEIPFHDCPC